MEGGYFILHRLQGYIGDTEFTCTEVIANEEIHSFYDQGRHQVWSHPLEEGVVHHVRCTERFVGPDRRECIRERSNTSSGWELSWRIAAERVG